MTTQMSHRELKKVRINWERLKEFVGKKRRAQENRYDDGSMGRCDEAEIILAEIERLEEGR